MNKKCFKCGVCKDASDFARHSKTKDGLQRQCRECQKAYRRSHYLKNKDKYKDKANRYRSEFRKWFNSEIKAKLNCQDCSDTRWWVLDFHHTDPSTKEIEISSLVSKCSKSWLMQELKKCVVLCASCHRHRHYIESNPDDA